MGKINLLIANSDNIFSNTDHEMIRAAAKTAESYLSGNYSFDYDVDIVITPPSLLMKTIPEDGITGRTYSSTLIIIVLDKDQAEITKDMVFETICHEMGHSMRWEKVPEYANTLFEEIIMEGLAVVLEEKALIDNGITSKQFFLNTMQETDQKTIDDMISRLKSDFSKNNYDYEKIFFTGNNELPRWAGYRLGYHFVKRHLEKERINISQATLASYREFVADYESLQRERDEIKHGLYGKSAQ